MAIPLKLGPRTIKQDGKPYIIAEIGVNHEGSLEKAKELIEQAKEGGADAAKFQSYKASTLASKHSPAYWDTKLEKTQSQHELFQKFDCFEPKDYEKLSTYCKSQDIEFLSTPFDNEAVDFLSPLVPFFKIASADITNLPLLRKIGSKEKPVILSTGASTLAEVDLALQELEKSGASGIVLMHCILNYPTPNNQAHLKMIQGLRRAYPENLIGYSDHTLPDEHMTALVTAWLLGAVIIEKHFTNDKSLSGNDHYHAIDKQDLKRLNELIERISVFLGPSSHKAPISTEEIARINARRSIVLDRTVGVGEILAEKDLTCKRPGTGISPLHWDSILGKKTLKSIEKDQLLNWDSMESDS